MATLSADAILTTPWPEPVWAVPDLLPVGLTILAGAPKMGKSWLALQLAQSVATGGMVFGERVAAGRVLYLALEDSPQRLKRRMSKQGWPLGLPVDFLTIGSSPTTINALDKGGAGQLAHLACERSYRFIVIDTLSRAVSGDQLDVAEMTAALAPLQAMAHKINVAVLLIDHHRKGATADFADAIGDILGSTAKGAICDTSWGLYRKRGERGATLAITGREIEERTLALEMDWQTGAWQLMGDDNAMRVTEPRQEILDALAGGPLTVSAIARVAGQDQSNCRKRANDMVAAGLLKRIGNTLALP